MQRILLELARSWGGKVVDVAQHLSGMRLCLKALSSDDLEQDERLTMHAIAVGHLTALVTLAVSGDEKFLAHVAACAQQIDEQVDEVTGPSPEEKRHLH